MKTIRGKGLRIGFTFKVEIIRMVVLIKTFKPILNTKLSNRNL